MPLSKKQLVMNDIIVFLKENSIVQISEIYTALIKEGKFRNYLTRDKFFAIMKDMVRRGVITRKGKTVTLNKSVANLTHKDILLRLLSKWPGDITEGLS